MRAVCGREVSAALLAAGMLAAASQGLPQAAAPASAAAGHVPAVTDRAAGPAGVGASPSPASPAKSDDTRTEKQKALAMQTERLFDMATELKAQVDKTNKNILSVKVVQKAEEIEALAKGMRAQAKKQVAEPARGAGG